MRQRVKKPANFPRFFDSLLPIPTNPLFRMAKALKATTGRGTGASRHRSAIKNENISKRPHGQSLTIGAPGNDREGIHFERNRHHRLA